MPSDHHSSATSPGLLGWFQRKLAERQMRQQRDAETLQVLEAIVEDADPRLRLIPGYRDRLKPAVRLALDYTTDLVARIPGPLTMTRETWNQDPQINAFFAAATDVQLIFSRSRELRKFFKDHSVNDCYALLTMSCTEKTTLAPALQGDIIRQDVPQTSISFSDHRLGRAAATEAEARQLLRQAALTFLATKAMEQMQDFKTQQEALETQRRVLQTKLKYLQIQQRSLKLLLQAENLEEAEQAIETVEQQLTETERQLAEARTRVDELDDYLEQLKLVLSHPTEYLALQTRQLRLNRLGVVVPDDATELANDITFCEATSGESIRRVFLLVHYPRSEMLPEQVWLKEAARPYFV